MRKAAAQGRLQHHGTGGELFVIMLMNVVLKILTLGLYHFWGKTRIRRYLWSATEFDGERLEYTGFGLELFYGFLKAFVVILVLVLALGFGQYHLSQFSPTAAGALIFAFYVVVGFLVCAGMYGARSYIVSRTRLRGIRFAQTGSAVEYAMKMLGYGLLCLVTLYLAVPFMRNALAGYTLNHTWYGSQQFSYDGKGRDLFGRYLVCWLLAIPTLGISIVWYLAAEMRYVWDHTRAGKVTFGLDLSGGALFGLLLTNLLIIVLTLGLGFPWVLTRSLRFTMSRLEVAGKPDYAALRQTTVESPSTGEGLAEMFDLAPA